MIYWHTFIKSWFSKETHWKAVQFVCRQCGVHKYHWRVMQYLLICPCTPINWILNETMTMWCKWKSFNSWVFASTVCWVNHLGYVAETEMLLSSKSLSSYQSFDEADKSVGMVYKSHWVEKLCSIYVGWWKTFCTLCITKLSSETKNNQ